MSKVVTLPSPLGKKLKFAGSILANVAVVPPQAWITAKGMKTNAKNINIPWILSVTQTARKPPKKV